MRILKKYRFKYRYILITRQFDIEAFSSYEAIERFHLLFPNAKIWSIKEVTNESK